MNLLSELKGICNVYELDEIERKEVVDQFLEGGRADLPLNKYVEQTSSIQSFSLKDFEKVYETYDDLMALIDTSDLPQDCKNKFNDCCRENLRLFAKHKYDIGYVTNVVPQVNLTTRRSLAQKHIPYPKKAEAEVDEILKKLEENAIIRRARHDEDCQFIQNIFVVQKPNGTGGRCICDARLINAKTIAPHTEFKNTLHCIQSLDFKSKVCSVIDIAHAFYSIPLQRKDQHSFSFINN